MNRPFPWDEQLPEEERAYYRTIEDFFATAKGKPHILSSKDFQLMHSWWREGIPLAAVLSGIAETFEKKRLRGDDDQVSSLSYCAPAVKRAAKRMAAARAGSIDEHQAVPDTEKLKEKLKKLSAQLKESAAKASNMGEHEAAEALIWASRSLGYGEASDEFVASIEAVLYHRLRSALTNETAERLHTEAEKMAKASGASGKMLERTRLALLDKLIADLFSIPPIEL